MATPNVSPHAPYRIRFIVAYFKNDNHKNLLVNRSGSELNTICIENVSICTFLSIRNGKFVYCKSNKNPFYCHIKGYIKVSKGVLRIGSLIFVVQIFLLSFHYRVWWAKSEYLFTYLFQNTCRDRAGQICLVQNHFKPIWHMPQSFLLLFNKYTTES